MFWRNLIRIAATASLLCGALAGFAATNSAPTAAAATSWLLDGIAAQVNGENITIGEVMGEIGPSIGIELTPAAREAKLRELYGETLNALIDRKLILSTARAEERKLQDWLVDDREREIVNSRFGGDRSKLMAMLATRNLRYDDWRRGIEEDLLLSAMRMEFVDKRISVPPSDVRAYYETNRAEFVTAALTRVGRITLTVSAQDETVEQLGARVLKELDDGADFAATARKFSSDKHADDGGDWGFINPPEAFAEPLVQALAGLKTGEYSRLVVIGGQGYILKKLDEKPSRPVSLEDAWHLIDRRLRQQQAERLYHEWTERLRRRAFVRVFDLPAPTNAP